MWEGNEWMEGEKATATENESPGVLRRLPPQFLSFLLIIVSAVSAQLSSARLWQNILYIETKVHWQIPFCAQRRQILK